MWAHKWKTIFNPYISKQVQEVVFSRKTDKVNYILLTFNAIPVAQTSHQKHFGLYLDEEINFNHHIKEIISKVNKRLVLSESLEAFFPEMLYLLSIKFSYGQILTIVILSMINLIMKVSVIILRRFSIIMLLLLYNLCYKGNISIENL